MNNINQKQNVLATIAMVAAISILNSLSTVQAQESFMPYGSIANEDELYTIYKGVIYVNVVPSQGNGMFMAITDIDTDYSIDQAIERFGIQEDVRTFEVQPSLYSDVNLVFQLNDDLQFEMIGAVV